MAVQIEALSSLSMDEQVDVLDKISEFFIENKKWRDFQLVPIKSNASMVDIDVDGVIYQVPREVNELLNAIYRMYEKEATKN